MYMYHVYVFDMCKLVLVYAYSTTLLSKGLWFVVEEYSVELLVMRELVNILIYMYLICASMGRCMG